MRTLANKQSLLEDAGYNYSFDREIYVNRNSKKVFCLEYVEDKPEDVLQSNVSEPANGEWHFYFNSGPSESVKRELTRLLG